MKKPWRCSLNKSRKPLSASVPQRYVKRRNEKRSKPHCTGYPRSLWLENQKNTRRAWTELCCQKRTITADRALLQGHTTSMEMGGVCVGSQSIIPIPREATSVATMMGLLPVLNSFKTQSRSFCCLSPWIANTNNQLRNRQEREVYLGEAYTVPANHPAEET